MLVAQTRGAEAFTINGNRFTTGTLRGNRVVVVLSRVSMINAAMTTQTLIDHFADDRHGNRGARARRLRQRHSLHRFTQPQRP